MAAPFKVGQRVLLADGRTGIVRFFGPTSFKEGDWLGVELAEPTGKNDGSVQGEQYFDCPPNHGMFMRPLPSIQILEQPKPEPPAPKNNGKAPATGGMRPPASRPVSISSTSTTSRGPRPSISGPGGLANKRASISAAPGATKPGAPSKRMSMAPPSSTITKSRQSLAPRDLSPKKGPRMSLAGPFALGGPARPGLRSPPKTHSPSPSIDRVLSPGSSGSSSRPPPPKPTPSAPQLTSSLGPRGVAQPNKQVEELQAKLRVMEKKRGEDRDRLKNIDELQEKVDRYEAVITKLQGKYQTQTHECNELRRQLKDSAAQFEQIEGIQAEHDTILEMAALDREMAEEKAEAYKAELDALQAKMEEMELENEILREENEELSKDMSPEERATQGWMQMQRENERLRDALLRLRDWSHEQEATLKAEIESLEEDSQELAKLKGTYDETKTRVLEQEAEIEDLREQLDAALGAEAMIEQLTDKNLSLAEQVEDLRNTVEDLQDLKDLNDELEIQHVEHEKQLQEVIDYKDSLIAEQARRAAQHEDDLVDREYTISRFRELVTNLQSDLEDMRASKEITESEAQELANHSRAMMDLNKQLQDSAMSTKIKTIDLELRRMEAHEASQHLAIVQLFLPEVFQAERDSVLALLRFRRIGFKARLLHSFVKERLGSPGPHAQGEQLLAACDALDKLTWISAMCERFANGIYSCSLEQFGKFEGALYELEPVERTLNAYIDNLRKDELRESQVTDGLQRSIAVMTHLAELHLRDNLESYAEEILMKTNLMQSNLETTAAALSIIKKEVVRATPPSEDGDDEVSSFARKADAFVTQSRSVKVVVGKILRSLEELKARSLTLTTDAKSTFESSQTITQDLTTSLRLMGAALLETLGEEGRATELTFSDLVSTIRNFNTSHFKTSDTDIFMPYIGYLRSLVERLAALNGLASDLSMTHEFERPPPPWVLRSKELAASKIVSVDAEAQIATLRREITERATALKLRDQTLEESNVKIEMLEARTRDVAAKVKRIAELEAAASAASGHKARLEHALEEHMKLAARVEEERDRWARRAAEMQALEREGDDPTPSGGSVVEVETLRAEMRALESANSYLRILARRAKAEEQAVRDAWLGQPLGKPAGRAEAEARERRREGLRGVEALAGLARNARPVKIDAPKRSSRLKWRPMKETPQWQVSEQYVIAYDQLGLIRDEHGEPVWVRSAGRCLQGTCDCDTHE